MIQWNTIYQEDCLQGMKKIPDASVDLIICDLPYGVTNCKWDSIIPFDQLWKEYKRIRKPETPIILFGVEPFSTMIRMSNIKEYRYDWYWEKNNVTGFAFAKYQPMRRMETISVFYKKGGQYFPQGLKKLEKVRTKIRQEYGDTTVTSQTLSGKPYVQKYTGYPTNILTFSKDVTDSFHPTQKPVALLEYLVKTYTSEGSVVLDHCMGSGTTAVACIQTNRKFIGFETDEIYYQKSLSRIKRVQVR